MMSVRPRICCDFDGTIFDGIGLFPGCIERLAQLRKFYSVAIFSAREDKCREWMIEYLIKNNVPHDEILPPKPEAAFYLDDKGRQFVGWDKIEL